MTDDIIPEVEVDESQHRPLPVFRWLKRTISPPTRTNGPAVTRLVERDGEVVAVRTWTLQQKWKSGEEYYWQDISVMAEEA